MHNPRAMSYAVGSRYSIRRPSPLTGGIYRFGPRPHQLAGHEPSRVSVERQEVITRDVIVGEVISSESVGASLIAGSLIACATIIGLLALIVDVPYSAEAASTIGALGLLILYGASQSASE